MENTFIGREEEQAALLKALQSSEAEMVALIGRKVVFGLFSIATIFRWWI